MTLEQAARQALEALIEANVVSERYQNAEKREQAITALREALANTRSSIRSTSEYSEQAEQEPVGVVRWFERQSFGLNTEMVCDAELEVDLPEGTKLYAAPVRTKNLTDDEIGSIYEKHHALGGCWTDGFAYERAVIAADRKKNRG